MVGQTLIEKWTITKILKLLSIYPTLKTKGAFGCSGGMRMRMRMVIRME